MIEGITEEQFDWLVPVLERAKLLGFLGPERVENHVVHALRFATDEVRNGGRCLDLGSGGGVPGLVLAVLLPATQWSLLDAMFKRCEFLRWAVEELTLDDRVEVLEGRAEILAREPDRRHQYDVVTARSFGKPAAVAECATGFLRAGGVLVVSEPPEAAHRWPAERVAELGLAPLSPAQGVVRFEQISLCEERFPRRDGVPTKRPLW